MLVDPEDLNNVRNHFGAGDACVLGDTAPFDGDLDLDDLNAVRNNFGATSSASFDPLARRNTPALEPDTASSLSDATAPAETLSLDRMHAAIDQVHAYVMWQRRNEALADLEVDAPWYLAIRPQGRRNLRRSRGSFEAGCRIVFSE